VASTAFRCTVHWGMVISLLSCFLLRSAEGEDLVLYGAGSLREVMTQIASDYQAVRGTHVRTDFGPSGLMREGIQRGERVDVFASADLGHPLQLQQEGRATIVVMFTRNTLCAVALPRLELTSGNFLDKLLDPGVKLGTSTPKADPDELCEQLHIDPLEFRLLNGGHEGTRQVAGPRFPRISYLETVQAAKTIPTIRRPWRDHTEVVEWPAAIGITARVPPVRSSASLQMAR
jgi:Bacterial extracellular solute-binding protein